MVNFKNLNTQFSKFLRALFGLFLLKVSVVILFLAIQACESVNLDRDKSELEREVALDDFTSVLHSSRPEVIQFFNQRKDAPAIQQSAPDFDEDSQNEQLAIQVIEPVLEGSKNLLKAYGLSEPDLIEILDGHDESYLALLGIALLIKERERMENSTANSGFFRSAFSIQSAYAQSDTKIAGCGLKAIGLDIFASLHDLDFGDSKQSKKMRKKLMKKALRTMGKRLLGPIGIAIAIGEFFFCLHT